MEINGKTVLVCDCEGTMPLDGARLAKACGVSGSVDIATQLCRRELARFGAGLGADHPLVVACTQESPRFEEQREEAGSRTPVAYVNIRERAGWSDEAEGAHAKIAALLAEAALDIKPADTVSMKSEGVTLIYGRDGRAIEAARQLQDRLNLTVLLTKPDDVAPPRLMDVPVLRGTIVAARGHLGDFELTVDDYAVPLPSSRATLAFERPRNGARSRCDLILDLSGGAPLFPAHEKRDGYLRPDPDSPAEVQKALFRMAELVGDFEKPRYVSYDAAICVHGRSGKTGCSRCLDSCPTGAIAPQGDKVEFDPYVCAGCGTCAAVCPTGAAGYTVPAPDQLLLRARTLLGAYHAAGGEQAVLLIHDEAHGEPLIDMLARAGRGLPARVLPFRVNAVVQLGIDFYSGVFAYGAASVLVLAPDRRRDDLAPLAAQFGLMEAVLGGLGYGGGRVGLIETDDPDVLGAALYDRPRQPGIAPSSFLPMGGKRGLTNLALRHLHDVSPAPVEILALPTGAPFGAVTVDTQGCTLCLACVSACPTGALGDNPDRPMLRFTEEACVQCGLCRNTCPETRHRADAPAQFPRGCAPRHRGQGGGAVPLRALRQTVRHQGLGRAHHRKALGQALDVRRGGHGRAYQDVRRLPGYRPIELDARPLCRAAAPGDAHDRRLSRRADPQGRTGRDRRRFVTRDRAALSRDSSRRIPSRATCRSRH